MFKPDFILPIENTDTEIEIKVKLDKFNFNSLQEWLKVNAQYLGKTIQEDYYFDNPDNSWFKIHEEGYKYALKYLRVRITDQGNSMCYKDWETSDCKGKSGFYCKDLEIPISDTKKHILLLESIGFTDKTKIKKHRKSYLYEDFIIDIDTVKDIGTFIEFEVRNKIYNNPKTEYNRIKTL